MSSFTSDLITKDLLDGRNVELMQTLRYDIGALGSPDHVVVPAHFITDYASSPWGFQNVFPRFGSTNLPAVLHDYLYRGGYILHEYTLQPSDLRKPPVTKVLRELPTRTTADGVFFEACIVRKVSWLKRQLGKLLRLVGFVAWRKGHRPEVVAQTRALEAADPGWPGLTPKPLRPNA